VPALTAAELQALQTISERIGGRLELKGVLILRKTVTWPWSQTVRFVEPLNVELR
jgi:hypothetical protein